MERLAVVYDEGAVHPLEAHLGLSQVASVVFLISGSPAARRRLPVIEQLGPTVLLDADGRVHPRQLAGLGLSGILTFSERMVPVTARLARELGLPYHDPHTVGLLTDKFRQRQRLREAGVDLTRSRLIRCPADYDAAVDAVGLPAVLKPAWGGGSRDTHQVDERSAGRRVAERMLHRAGPGGAFVMEELLCGRRDLPAGDYVSVESAVVSGRISHLAVTGKFPLARPFREVGQFWPAALKPTEAHRVRDLTSRALRALGVAFGLTHTELKLTPDGPRIIEVNGRLGGHINELSIRSGGADLVALAGRIALGHPVEPEPAPVDRLFWQYNNPAPSVACRLVSVTGAREVCSVAGVTGYTPYARIGELLADGVMTRPLDLVCGEAASHPAMARQIDQVLDRLSFTFAFSDGERTVAATDLSRH